MTKTQLEKKWHNLLSRIMRLGGWAGVLLLVLGAILYYFHPLPVTEEFPGFVPLITSLIQLDANAFLHSGVLLLLLTPLFSIMVVNLRAIINRDWRLVIITSILILIIVFTVVMNSFGMFTAT